MNIQLHLWKDRFSKFCRFNRNKSEFTIHLERVFKSRKHAKDTCLGHHFNLNHARKNRSSWKMSGKNRVLIFCLITGVYFYSHDFFHRGYGSTNFNSLFFYFLYFINKEKRLSVRKKTSDIFF